MVVGLFNTVVGKKEIWHENVLVTADNLTNLTAPMTISATKLQSHRFYRRHCLFFSKYGNVFVSAKKRESYR